MNKQPNSNGSHYQYILVISPILGERLLLNARLQQEGFIVHTVSSSAEATAILHYEGLPQLAIVDIETVEVAENSVANVVHQLAAGSIIFLTNLADPQLADRGAEDIDQYHVVARPLNIPELLAAIYEILRLGQLKETEDAELVIDARLRVNFAQEYIRIDNRPIRLSPTENRLLYTLYCYRGQFISPELLLAKAWKPKHKRSKCSLWAHVSRLRDKLQSAPDSPDYISTIRGKGYGLCVDHTHKAVVNPGLISG